MFFLFYFSLAFAHFHYYFNSMRKCKISFLILLFSLFAGNLAPVWSTVLFETPPPETSFFENSTNSNSEFNAIPVPSTNTHTVKSFKPSSLHHTALTLYKNSLPELHNQLIRIDQKTPQSSGNKYLNFIYDFQTIK